MKAFLLAAGLGTRLRPITNNTPKCLVRVDDRPLLDIWLESFAQAGVDEVLVNAHYMAEIVARHLAARTGSPSVRMSFEPELLGSAGTLRANRRWVEDEEMFLVCYADNLTSFDLGLLIDAHRERWPIATLAAFHSENPAAGGVLQVALDGRVVGFEEKPAEPATDLVNAGMYAFSPDVIDEIDAELPRDIGYHLLPRLVGRAFAVPVECYFRDIGTVEAYQHAREEWPALARR
jgi:mannose-1-phosphate guanylyltransferase